MAEEEARTIQALMNQEEDGIERDDFGNAKAGTIWNILSGSWYRKWRATHGLSNGRLPCDLQSEEALGPIDNADILLDKEEYYVGDGSCPRLDTVMKAKLLQGEDYLIMPPKAWEILAGNYGVKPGSVIQRVSIPLPRTKETQVEVTLRKLMLGVYISGEKKLLDPKAIYLSRKATLSDMKSRLLVVLQNIVPSDSLRTDNFKLWQLSQYLTFETDIKKQFAEKEEGAILAFPGKLLTEDSLTLDEAEIMWEAVLVAEFKESEGNWLYRSPDVTIKPKCSYCQAAISNPIQCFCKKVLPI